ncbi:MAG: ABC transporter permease [Candidatus Aminicenantes bacterium]|nr:ABC transporter permease [Candidatus Aminicenantes bacterium]
MKLAANLREVYKHRLLIRTLVGRELKARYRGTVLGFFWSFFNPLLLMIVYTVVFGFILKPRDPSLGEGPWMYALYLFAGILPWTWFSSSSNDSANVLMINGNLIKKIIFPAEILPIVSVSSNFVNFLFGLPILLIFLIVFGKPPTVYALLLPVVMLVQYLFTLGFALLLSALTVHFRDIKDILGNLLTFWFFSTPIVYSLGALPESSMLRKVLNFNPMTHIIAGYHDCLFFGRMPDWTKLGVTLAVSVVLFLIGYAVFDRLRDSFPEEV